MSEQSKVRRIFATRSLVMRPYDMDGPVQPEMSYARLSHEADSERGSYLIRMQPGTRHSTRTITGCAGATLPAAGPG